jgi:hypothetical protein
MSQALMPSKSAKRRQKSPPPGQPSASATAPETAAAAAQGVDLTIRRVPVPVADAGAGAFLFAIGLAASAAGNFNPPLALGLLAPILLILLSRCGVATGGLVCAILSLIVAIMAVPPDSSRWTLLWYLIIALAAADLGTSLRQRGPAAASVVGRALLRRYLAIAAVVLLFDLGVLANPAARVYLDEPVRSASRWLTGLFAAKPLPLGPTYWSLPVLVAFIILAAGRGSWARALLTLAGGALALVGYFGIIAPLQNYGTDSPAPRSLLSWFERYPDPFQLASEPIDWGYILRWLAIERPQIVLIALLAMAFWTSATLVPSVLSLTSTIALARTARRRRTALIAVAFGIGIGIWACWITSPRTVPSADLAGRKVAIMTSNILMKVPEHGHYGERSLGMFGRLPGSLRSLGMAVDEIKAPSELRKDHQILILINLQESFSPSDKSNIQQWTKAGGGLLVLTDHTGDKALRLPTNDLVGEFGLRANFDSGRLFTLDGTNNFERLIGSPAEALRGVRWRPVEQYGTGASLAINPPAIPVLQSRFAYSDPGSFTAVDRGLCGNLRYDVGEPLGDIPLVGFARAGKGRVILFGDTSPFQNGAFASAHHFIRHVLGTLLPRGPSPGMSIAWVPPIILLAAALAALAALRRVSSRVSTGILALVIAWGAARAVAARPTPAPLELANTPTAVIDVTKAPYAGMEDWTNTDLGGLQTCLMREQYTPIISEIPLDAQADKLRAGDALFLVAPLCPLSEPESRAIDRFMRRGGRVVVNCGREEADQILGWLQTYGLSISNTPLGATPEDEALDPNHIHFFNAWVLQGDGEVIAKVRRQPVAMSKPVGAGRLTLIGDSKFFWNVNIESRESHRPGNIAFLGRLLKDDRSTGGGGATTAPVPTTQPSR